MELLSRVNASQPFVANELDRKGEREREIYIYIYK